MNQEFDRDDTGIGRSRSGKARMAKLSPDERVALAKKGASMRWAGKGEALRAICGSKERPWMIGDVAIPCYVLENETRVITFDGMGNALGVNVNANARLFELLTAIIPDQAKADALFAKLKAFIKFYTSESRSLEFGYEGSLLADMCESILEARQQGRLPERFSEIGVRAELLIRGFARVGIDAIIDEVTGYQEFRSRDALIKLLSKYISNQLLEWTKTFPDDFYLEIFRLKGWDYKALKPGDHKPSVIGRYTRNIVYERMPVPVIEQLEHLNPVTSSKGDRRHKHHQFLTRDIGHPELKIHIEKVMLLMNLSENWEDFRSKLRKVMPKKWEQFSFQDLLPDPADAPPSYADDGLD